MPIKKITPHDVMESISSNYPLGQIERLESDVKGLQNLFESLLSTLSAEQLLAVYVSTHGDTQHYDSDKRYVDEIEFGTADSD